MNKIEQSEKLIQWTDEKINGLEFKADGRKEIVAASLDVAMEHQKAIITLIAREFYGSAFSLIRVLFETYIRSLWLNYCASDKELEKFKKNKLDKQFQELINDIEQIKGYSGGTLSKAKKAGWKAMNSFTHSGFTQIERRYSQDSISPNYDQVEIDEAIDFSNATGLLCCLEISFLTDNEKISQELLEKIKEI
ncbi:DUF6988 family protein [Desulfosediminicola ganghwensis]|uniref:DUF6988 family protein n=1 Tax=Desulfosediminicola ganghwensis TaxID=2569540 RepID=UPI0010AB9864|nr:DUF5677 domain-containing protein [Desulfosediminicola ganghwensis]